MRAPALGGSTGCGITRFGASKLLKAFKSGPVIAWHSPTRAGALSRHTISNSRALSRSRFKISSVVEPLSGSKIPATCFQQRILPRIAYHHAGHVGFN